MTLSRVDSHISFISLVSSASSSHASDTSTECDAKSGSSTSTIEGPGALTGKALKALGIATLRGFGRLVMARHLSVVAHTFPHTNEQASRIRHIDAIYDDLLEFSRPGMYSVEVNGKALALILEQVDMGQTRYLVRAVSRWHPTEIHILLVGILTQLAHIWNPSLRGVFSSPVSQSKANAGSEHNEPPILRLIFFFSKLIRSGAFACRIVLDVGFLDVLLSLNHYYRFGVMTWHSVAKETYNLYIACNAALFDIVSGYPEFRDFVAKHPISSMWPVSQSQPPAVVPHQNRCRALFLGPEMDVVLDDPSPFACLNLPKLCSQPCVSTIPVDEMLQSLTFEVTHDQALRVFLTRSTYKTVVKLLLKIFFRWSELMVTPCQKPAWHYRLLFSLHFIKQVSDIGPTSRQALLGSGAIEYLTVCLRETAPLKESHVTAADLLREQTSYELDLRSTIQLIHQTVNALKFGDDIHFGRPRAHTH